MNQVSYPLEFITPCFCAGADQSHAEVRAPAIRGQLRWWFRVLGGIPEQERRVFGGIGGGGAPAASALVVRCNVTRRISDKRDLPTWQGNAANDPLGYLCYFATVSGEGRRWQQGAFLSPGSAFTLALWMRRPVLAAEAQLLERTVCAWTRLGNLGMRATRCFGALRNQGDQMTEHDFLSWAATHTTFRLAEKGNCVPHSPRAWQEAMRQLGSFLKGLRKDRGLKGKDSTVLGCSDPRLSSALHLRPVWVKEGILPVVIYADTALPDDVRRGRPEVEALFAASSARG